jgi:hypothetical protein
MSSTIRQATASVITLVQKAKAWQKACLLLGIVVPWFAILYYAVPIIPLGVEDLSMVRYFDADESLLVSFGMRLYRDGVLPQEMSSSYPRLFYYLCGIVLYPYTAIYGVSAKMVAITFRSVNTLAMLLTIIPINLIGIRFFRSYIVGAASAVLFALTPQYLFWATNSRPHPLEILFLVLCLYQCLKAVDTRTHRALWGAVIWAGLAAGTKFGGFFLVPTIALVFGYLLWTGGLGVRNLNPGKAFGYLVGGAAAFAGVGGIGVALYALFRVPRSSTGITVAQELGWRTGLFSWPFGFGLAAGVLVLAAGIAIMLLHRRMISTYNRLATREGSRAEQNGLEARGLFAYQVFLFACKASVAVSGIYLLVNFDFFIYPVENLWIMLRRVILTSHGTDYQRDWDYFAWLPFFTETRCLGISGVMMALYYLALESIGRRARSVRGRSVEVMKRLVLLSYSAVLMGFLMVVVQHRTHHYLLPIILCLIVLGTDAIVRTAKCLIHGGRAKAVLFIAAGSTVMLACAIERLPHLFSGRPLTENRGHLLARAVDPAVSQFAPWLLSRHPESARIMTDDATMYIPAAFGQVSVWRANLNPWAIPPGLTRDAFKSLADEKPVVFVQSNDSRLDTTWAGYGTDLSELEAHYRVVKTFSYGGTKFARVSYLRDEIRVYERLGFSPVH